MTDDKIQNPQDKEQIPNNNSNAQDMHSERPWFAIHYSSQYENTVEKFFLDKNIGVYIPKQYEELLVNGKIKKVLRPVVRNLLFVRKDKDEKSMLEIFSMCSTPLWPIKKDDGTSLYEIRPLEMAEFQIMCNPDLYKTRFLSREEAILKKGDAVRVTHGPLKGLTGKLVRVQKQYYLMKSVPDISVLLKVSRWCCKPIE